MQKIKDFFWLLSFKLRSSPTVSRPLWRSRVIIFLSGAILLFFLGRFAVNYLKTPQPTISLLVPKENEVVSTDDLYVRGLVLPLGSKVTVNDQSVSLNGDGTFTTILKIQEGQNVLRVTAERRGKRAEVLRLVRRDLTAEEKQAKGEAQAKEEAEARAQILSKDQEIAQVQGVYTQREVKKVRVIEQALKDDFGLKRVVGRVVNDTEGPAFWVKVTASFLDKQGGKLEEKIAFVTSFEKFLKPGEEASFETQSIEKPFDHYQVDVTWEKE